MESQVALIGGEVELGKLPRGYIPARQKLEPGVPGQEALKDVEEEVRTGAWTQYWTRQGTHQHRECHSWLILFWCLSLSQPWEVEQAVGWRKRFKRKRKRKDLEGREGRETSAPW